MTTHLIGYEDVAFLGYNIGYLEKLQEHIQAFKIKLGLVPPAEYKKYNEPVLDEAVNIAQEGSSLWVKCATTIRSLHEETQETLSETIALLRSHPCDSRMREAISSLQCHSEAFRQQQVECDRIVECIKRVTPRFIDFMNVRIHEYAKRRGLLATATGSSVPETLNSAITDEQSLASARGSIDWNYRVFSEVVLSAGNMGAYCSRVAGLLEATVDNISRLSANQSPRRLEVSCRSAASPAREAQRLVQDTFDHVLRFRF